MHVFVFDIFDIEAGRYLTPSERMDFYLGYIAGNSEIVHHAPVIGTGVRPELESLEQTLQFAERQVVNKNPAEGIVYKRADGKESFKVISNAYLLKHDL
jgi:ATP-dependent RNA circularization protein (DNA/RNA ligase family)